MLNLHLGSVYDMTLSYDVPFWLAGIFLFVSAAISFTVPLVRRYVQRRQHATDKSNGGNFCVFIFTGDWKVLIKFEVVSIRYNCNFRAR